MAELQFKTAVYLPGSVLMCMVQEIKAGVNWFVARVLVNIVTLSQVNAASHKPVYNA